MVGIIKERIKDAILDGEIENNREARHGFSAYELTRF